MQLNTNYLSFLSKNANYKLLIIVSTFLLHFSKINAQQTFTQQGGIGTVYYETANNINYNGNIYISPGVHVILTGSWKMNPGTKIIISSLGMLTVKNGGSITNALTLTTNVNNEWSGIEVRGNSQSDQSLADQIEDPNWSFVNNWSQLGFGAFVMNGSNSSVSGATYGIVAGSFQTAMPYISSIVAGGVIRINGGEIYNCSKMCIGFASHKKARQSRIVYATLYNSMFYQYYSAAQLAI